MLQLQRARCRLDDQKANPLTEKKFAAIEALELSTLAKEGGKLNWLSTRVPRRGWHEQTADGHVFPYVITVVEERTHNTGAPIITNNSHSNWQVWAMHVRV